MFKDHAVILKMFDVDPRTIHPANFYLLDILQKDRKDLLDKAKSKKSYGLLFYALAKTWRKERDYLIRQEIHFGQPQKKIELKQTRRAA